MYKILAVLDATQVFTDYNFYFILAMFENTWLYELHRYLSASIWLLSWQCQLYSTGPEALFPNECGRRGLSTCSSTVCDTKARNWSLAR